MIYEIINMSDPITIEADDVRVAAIATVFVGEGAYGLHDENGETVMPIMLFGDAQEALDGWCKEHEIEFDSFAEENREAIATCLETALIGDLPGRKSIIRLMEAGGGDIREALKTWNDENSSSLNDICGRAFALARALRERDEAATGTSVS